MKNKKSLLSVLLAAVLLCACVAGMLIFGANAEGDSVKVTVDGTEIKTVVDALKKAKDEIEDAITTSIEITLKVSTTEEVSNTLFSTDDFSAASLNLPIVINGEDNTIIANVEEGVTVLSSAIDLTLNNVTLSTDATQLNLGNREVVLDGAVISDNILLNDRDVTPDDPSSLTIQGETDITGNVVLLDGQTQVLQNATTSLDFDGGKVDGKVFGANGTVKVYGTVNMTIRHANANFKDVFCGLGGSAVLSEGATFNFEVDGADLNCYELTPDDDKTNLEHDVVSGIHGKNLDGASSTPTVTGTFNFNVSADTNSTSIYAVYLNVNLTTDGVINVNVSGSAMMAQYYVYTTDSTSNDTKFHGTINVKYTDFTANTSVWCFYIATAAAGEKVATATAEAENGLQFNCTVEGDSKFSGTFFGFATPSNSVKCANAKVTAVFTIKSGTFKAVRLISCITKLDGDCTYYIYTTSFSDIENVAATNVKSGTKNASISFSSQVDLAWSSALTGTATLRLNGGKNRTITIGKDAPFFSPVASVVNNKILNTSESTAMKTCTGFRNGVGGTVTNYIENANIAIFLGAGCNNGSLSATATSISNTLVNVKVGTYYGYNGNHSSSSTVNTVTNDLRGCVITGSFYASSNKTTNGLQSVETAIEGGTFSGAFIASLGTVPHVTTINGGTFNSTVTGGDVTIKGGTFGGAVTGDTVTLGGDDIENAAITLQGAGSIVATDVAGKVTVTKADEWGAFGSGTLYLSVPTDKWDDVEVISTKEYKPVILKRGNNTEVYGYFALPAIQLDLVDRVVVKAHISKADMEKYKTLMESYPKFSFAMSENTLANNEMLAEQFENLVEVDGNYVFTITVVGAGDFNKTITFSTLNLTKDFTILQIAYDGAAQNEDNKYGPIFYALYDYGLAATDKDAALSQYNENTVENFFAYAESLSKEGVGATPGEAGAAFEFKSVTLLMGDTIGIRLKSRTDDQTLFNNMKVFVGGIEQEKDMGYAIGMSEDENSVVCLDIFVNIEHLETILSIKVEDASGTSCIEYNNSAALIASALAAKDMENDNEINSNKLLATAMLMMAVHNFYATQA